MSQEKLDNLTQDGGAENAPEWNPTPEDLRAMDLGYFVKALRKMSTLDLSCDDLISNHRSVVVCLAISSNHLRDDLLAWAEGERAKLKAVL
jgi:hypothetical protein